MVQVNFNHLEAKYSINLQTKTNNLLNSSRTDPSYVTLLYLLFCVLHIDKIIFGKRKKNYIFSQKKRRIIWQT